MISFTLEDDTVDPTVAISIDAYDTSCGGTTDGQLSATVDGGTTGYDFEWFTGTSAGTAGTGFATTSTISGLAAGDYSVRATDNTGTSESCEGTATVTLGNVQEVITATLDLTDQDDCSPANGAASIATVAIDGVNVADFSSDYTFDWDDDGDTGNGTLQSGATSSIGSLSAGTYFVTVTNTISNCASDVIEFDIEDNSVDPTVAISIDAFDRSCGGTTNGQLSASVDGNTAGYDFEWFTGTSAGTAGTGFATTATITGVASGNYSVRVTDNTGTNLACEGTATVTLDNVQQVITATISTTDQDNCSPVNGTASITTVEIDGTNVADFSSGYTFDWDDDTDTGNGTIQSGTTSSISSLASGTYYATVTNITSGCVSDIVEFVIDDISLDPTVAISLDAYDTSCGGTTDGQLSASVDGGTAGYDFEWFSGTSAGTAGTGFATTSSVTGLAAGDYTVRATDNTGSNESCEGTATFTLDNVQEVITATMTSTDQDDCSPANGTASVSTVAINGANVTDFSSGYTFDWDDDTDTGNGTIQTSTSSSVIGLAAGTYYLTVTNNTSNCSSDIIEFTIDDITVDPTVAISVDAFDTSCGGTTDGILSASVDGGTSGYDFEWFSGTSAGTAGTGFATTATISGLASGDYTVRATDNTGSNESCEGTLTVTLDNVQEVITATLTLTDQDDCTPENGEAEITSVSIDGTIVSDFSSGYTFDWDDDNNTGNGTLQTGSTSSISGLAAGTYYVTVTNNTSDCSSDVVQFTIDDISLNPTVAISIDAFDTSCGGTTDGQLSATVDGSTVGFDFEWFSGTTAGTAGTGFATTASVSGLAAGDYAVRATDNTGSNLACEGVAIVTLDNVQEVVTATLTVVDQDDCIPENGEASITSVAINGTNVTDFSSGFNFDWDNDNNTGNGTVQSGTTSSITGLAGGTYYVTVTNTTSNCSSDIIEFSIEDISLDPTVAINIDAFDTSCGGTTDGQLSASVDGGTSGFDFEWFTGTSAGTAGTGFATTSTITGVAAGDYTVRATDNTGSNLACTGVATVTLDNVQEVITSTFTTTNQDDCTPENGTATITSVAINGIDVADFSSGFTFDWDDDNDTGNGTLQSGTTSSIIGLAAGTYYITVTNSTSNCASDIIEFIIDDVSSNPTVAISTDAFDKSCGGTSDGQLSASVNGGTSGYDFEWYTGTTAGSAGTGFATTATITGLASGDYTVRATDNTGSNEGCEGIATITLDNVQEVITATLSLTDQSDCTPEDGAASIATVAIDDLDVADFSSGYNFDWDDDSNTGNGTLLSGTTSSISGLAAGTYYVTVTNTTSNCSSDVIEFTLDDLTSTPTVSISQDAFDTSCAGGTDNGALSADVNGSTSGYDFEWFTGATAGTAGTGFATTASLTGLAAGDYSVRATDNTSTSLGCVAVATFTLESRDIELTLTVDINSHQLNCDDSNATGDVEVTDILVDGVTVGSANFGNYTVEWYDDANLTNNIFTGLNPSGLADDTYYVVVTDPSTNCSSKTVAVDVLDESEIPVVIFDEIAIDTYCSAGITGTGELSAQVNFGGSLTTTDYTFTWYRGTTLNADNNITAGGTNAGSAGVVAGTNGSRIANLSADTYTVVVVDTENPNNGCSVTASFELTSQPDALTVDADDYSFENNTICDNSFSTYDGAIQIDAVRVNGSIDNISNYSFTWSAISSTGASLSGTTQSDVGGGTNNRIDGLRAGTYEVNVTNATKGCTLSEPIEVTIEDDITDPVVEFTTTNNTVCDPAFNGNNYNGTVTATATLGGSTFAGSSRFDFVWYEGTTVGVGQITTGIASGSTDNVSVVSNLETSRYTVVVTDNVTGCTVTATQTVPELLDIPDLTIPEARVTDNTSCDVANYNGRISLVNSDISGNDLSQFNLELFLELSTGVLSSQQTQTNTDANLGTFTGLQPGKFYIIATNVNTGCSTAAAQAIIENRTVTPQITITDLVSDIGCGSGLGTGAITIEADGGVDTYQWYSGGSVATGTLLAGETSRSISGLVTGTYTVYVENSTTTCSRELAIAVPQEAQDPVVAAFNTSDQTDCNGNGSASITEMRFNGSTTNVGDFNYVWNNSLGSTVASGDGVNSISNQLADTYTVAITHIATGCTNSTDVEITIDENIILPFVEVAEVNPDQTCSGTNGNGVLSATGDGNTDANANYAFEWYLGNTALTPGTGFATTSIISDLLAGSYTVRVNNNLSGCENTETYVLENIALEPAILALDTIGATTCSPANGGITVTSVTPGNIGTFTYQFYEDQFPSASIQDSSNPSITGLTPGVYFVVATDTTTNCTTPAVQVEVPDDSAPPVIVQDDIDLQTNCNDVPNGTMTVSGDGSTDTALYSFAWYNGGQPVSGSVISTEPLVTDLAAGEYTVVVTNLNTGCFSTETFTMLDDRQDPLQLTTTSSANSNCVNPNGQLSVSVLNPTKAITAYDYYWFEGVLNNPDINNDPIFSTLSFVENVPNGTYTVLVIDRDGGCESLPQTETVQDDTNTDELIFEITEDEPLTNCDPERPNGIATATPLSGPVSRYDFRWYEGNDTSGNLIDSLHLTVDSLSAITYTVEMIDRITGCSITDNITIRDATLAVSTPEITKISDRVSCIEPNGQATASVNGEILNFTFTWYNALNPTDTLVTGNSIGNLDEGEYIVIAQNNATGCISDPESVNIFDVRRDPEFTVVTRQSECSFSNGEAALDFERSTEIDSIVWTVNVDTIVSETQKQVIRDRAREVLFIGGNEIAVMSRDLKFVNAPGGEGYRIFLRDGNGCTNEATFDIETDIIIYNGVSANGDGLNDIFLIDCAQFFPGNKVKIYNRSGQLVYEIDDYDNVVNVFDGQSNRGVSVSSAGLPAGTYFYIFDKGDGSDTVQGYLELVR